MKHAIHHIHFVGIGGAGMSGIAEVLHNLGYTISGSDLADSATLRRLQALGIATHLGHAAAHIAGANAVVTSTAVQPDNPEVLAARAQKIPVVPRALMLAELMRMKQGIAIAGAHGKTTTTSLVTSVLAEAGLDPTFVIGGKLNSAGANAKLGQGEYIVVEADESDASFLNLLPVMAVVTNIDADHMETYGHDFGRLKKAFVDFLHRMPFYGTAVLCLDSPAVRDIVPEVTCPITSYGFAEDAQVRAIDVRAQAGQMHFTVQRRNGVTLPDLEVVLNLAGEHNVLNALAAIAIAVELNIPDEAVLRALAHFKGVGRRFQRYGELPAKDGGQFTLIVITATTPWRWPLRWRQRAARFRGGAWCWPSSRTATPAHATASKISSRSLAVPTPCCSPRSMPPVRRPSSLPMAAPWRAACAWRAGSSRCLSMRWPRCRRRWPTWCRTAMWCCAWARAPSGRWQARWLICYKIVSWLRRMDGRYEPI